MHPARSLLPLLVTLLLLTACGSAAWSPMSSGEISSPAGLSSLLQAVRHRLERPAGFRVRSTGGALLGPGATSVTGAGVFDFGAGQGDLTLAGAQPRRTADAVFTPQILYVRGRSPAAFLPPGRRWLAIDFAGPAALARNFPQIADQAEAVDPGLALRELLWGAVSTRGSSAAILGGASVRRVDVDVDLRSALRRVTAPAGGAYTAAIESQLAALDEDRGSHGSAIAVHAFLTQTGQLIGLEWVPPGAGAGGVAMTFGPAGAPVHAIPPPASQVADLAALTPSGERENQNGGDADGG